MADNVTANAGSGGAVFATDDIGGVHYPITKITIGALDSQTLLTGGSGVVGAGTVRVTLATDVALPTGSNVIGAVTQSGTWNLGTVTAVTAISNALPTGSNVIGAVTQSGTWNLGTVTAVTGITNALPAGTNAIGKLAANSGVDIGDVDVTSIIPGTGATNLGKAIDTATGATDTGVLLLATRDDALGTLTPLEGDNVQLRTDANGALWVIPSGTVTVGSHAVTNAGTFAVQVDGTALTRLTDIETNTDSGAVTGNGTAATSQRVTLASDSTGVLATVSTVTNLSQLGGQAIAMGTGVRSAGTQRVTIATDDVVPASQSGTWNIGTVTTVTGVTTVSTVTNLSQLGGVAISMNTGVRDTGTQRVTIATNDVVPASQSGTWNIGTVTALTGITNALPAGDNNIGNVDIVSGTLTTLTTLTGGGVAHDGADSGNPVKVGGRAVSAEITAIANNDRADFVTDLVGKQIVLPYANPENFVSGAITTAMTGTTSTSLLAAPAAGLRNYITQITVSNSHGTVGTDVIIQDGSGGTTLYTIPAAPAYGGATIHFPVPLRQPTTATAIFCANVTTGSSTKVSASGYKGV